MTERTPSKPGSTCRKWGRRAASFKYGLGRLTQEFNKKVETFFKGELAFKEAVPVPMSPPCTPTPAPYAPFPEPATPPGVYTRPVGQHDVHEASGSNHTSTHTSEYFDAIAKDPLEYLQQHLLSDYAEIKRLPNRKQWGSEHAQQGIVERNELEFEHPQQRFERPHPGLDEQLAGSLDNMFLNTPTALHASHPHPWDDQLNPVDSVSSVYDHCDPPVQENYYSGELNPIWFHLDDATAVSHGTNETYTQTTTTTAAAFDGLSVRTGETGDKGESLTDDTAGTSTPSPYVLPPMAEPRPFYKIYADFRGLIGDGVAFESGRIGRGMRVVGKALCCALRLRTKLRTVMGVKLAKAHGKRIREPQQRSVKFRQQRIKRMRQAHPNPPARGSPTHFTTDGRYKGVNFRAGRWHAETRVSTCKNTKVWIGTFSSEKEAALAMDAGYYHCTEKHKVFNFPHFVDKLGESKYQTVLALCEGGKKEEARKLVKKLAADHAAAFRAL